MSAAHSLAPFFGDTVQLAKALVMRGHAMGKEVANELIRLLASTQEEGHKKYVTPQRLSLTPPRLTECQALTFLLVLALRKRLSILAAQSMDVIIGDSADVLNTHTSSRIRVTPFCPSASWQRCSLDVQTDNLVLFSFLPLLCCV
jgi:hypothetical protein